MIRHKIETVTLELDGDQPVEVMIQASIAISLKRIADMLEAKQKTDDQPLFEKVFGKV